MTDYAAQLALAVGGIALHEPLELSWCGRRHAPLPAPLVADLPDRTLRALRRTAVAQVLYEGFYCRGRPVPLGRSGAAAADPAFAATLSSANAGTGSWDRGWRVCRAEAHGLVVTQDGLRVRVGTGEWRSEAVSPSPGATVAIRMPKELPAASPGYYTAVGDAELRPAAGEPIVRAYFHATASGAAPLVRGLTAGLNARGLPFRLKVLNAPAAFIRCDAAVVVLPATCLQPARPVLRDVADRLRALLRPATPAFTRPVAHGVALAEQPRTRESFGENRCRLLADGIVAAYERGLDRPAEREALVWEHLARAGIDPRAPYVHAGAPDAFTL
jgi:hypothetical protein